MIGKRLIYVIITDCETIIKAVQSTTGEILAGVTVTYAINGQEPEVSTTGRDGTVDLGMLEIDSTLDIELTKEGYDTIEDNFAIGASSGVPISMPLNPSTIGGIGRIVLSWRKHRPKDLDLHVKSDDGCHVSYKKKHCGGNDLDTDNTVKSSLIIDLILEALIILLATTLSSVYKEWLIFVN